jgi:AmiR/NasT family two-component response regulator
MSSPALHQTSFRQSRIRPSLGSHDVEVPPTVSASAVERVRALEAEVEQLRTAMASRAVIEQAKGVLMLLTGCRDQVAFDLLTHISSHTHRKVREIASILVGSATGGCPLPDDVRAILRDACPPSHPLN